MSGGTSPHGEFRDGWPVVLAATLGIAFGLPTLLFYTLGLIGPELVRQFGWSHTAVHGGLTVLMTSLVLLAPVAGWLATQFGARTCIAFSQAALGLAMMSFALLQNSLPQYYAMWILTAVVGAAATPAVITLPLVRQFVQRRGLALGLALLGTGLFAMTMKPVVAYALTTIGWRWTYVALGCLPILIGLPLTLWSLRNRAVASARGVASQTASNTSDTTGLTLPETLRNWRFWLLTIAFLPCALTLAGILPHIEGVMLSLNFGWDASVTAGAAIGGALMTGRLVCGFLIDRLWAPGVGAAILVLAAAGNWMLSGTDSFATALTAAVLIAFAGGAEYDLVGYLVSRYFGTRSYAAISGSLFAVFTLGGGVGPLLYARAVDATGSYRIPLIVTAAVLLATTVPLLCLGRYRTFR